MTDKEQIIIDGKKQYCKILFRCKHIDDTAAYDMMCEGIEITPENAPIGDFELMLIENTDSPFGFSSICKRNNKEDVWEYSGFGNSGACSIVTALLKQLARKTQECEELSILAQEESARNGRIEYELNDKLKQKTQECENLKAEEKYLKQCCQKAGEELAKHSFDYDGKEKNLVVQAMELNEKYEKLIDQNASLQKQVEDMIEWQKTVIRLFDRTCRCQSLDEKTAICKENGKECISIVGCRVRYRKECEELKEKISKLQLNEYHYKNELKKYKKGIHKYKIILKNKINDLYLSRREFLKAVGRYPKFEKDNIKTALDTFNKKLELIDNPSRCRHALEEIENFMNYEFSGQNEWVKTNILDIIDKAKGKGNE